MKYKKGNKKQLRECEQCRTRPALYIVGQQYLCAICIKKRNKKKGLVNGN